MKIVWSKQPDRAPGMTCYRDDGSTTFQSNHQGHFFAFHDLIHYAVETTLGYRHAFWGLVAGGRDLGDFGSQDGKKDDRVYDPEAIYAEVIVGIVTHVLRSELPLDASTLNPLLEDGCKNHGIPSTSLSQSKWQTIVEAAQDLHSRLKAVPEDGKLELYFPLSPTSTHA